MNTLYLAKGAPIPARRAEPGRTFLFYSWDALSAGAAAGLPGRPWEDDFPRGDAAALGAEIEALSRAWYRDGERDFTLFSGVSLGAAHEWLFWNLSVQPLGRFLAALEASVRRESAKAVLCESSLPGSWREALRSFCAARGLALDWIPHPGAGREIYAWQPPAPRPSALKRLAGRLLDASSRARGDGGKPRALVSWYPSLDRLLDRDDSPFAWTLADFPSKKRVGAALRRGWRVQHAPWGEPAWEPAERAALESVQADWRRLREDAAYGAALTFRGTPLLPALRPALDALFAERLEPLAWAARETARLLREAPPALVLLPYDTPPFQRVLAALARARGIPTALLLHGLPWDVDYPFSERHCDELLVWGPEQAGEYAAAAEPRVAQPVGNPGFDRHAGRRAAPVGRVERVLVLPRAKWADVLDGASDFEPQRYALGVADALAAAGVKDVVFRPHPAESPEYYRELLGGRARVETAGAFDEALAGADLVIGTYSTTLLEVMLHGKPLLCVNFTAGLEFAPPFDGRWGVDVLRTPAELQARLRRLLQDPAAETAALCAPYPRVLEAYAGPVDGRASERVLEALAALARRGRSAPKEIPA